MNLFGHFYSYWDEAYHQYHAMMKACGSVSPRTYGESIKRSKKKRKKVKRGK